MSKTDANIKIGADTTAFSNKMQELGQKVHDALDGIGKAYMGVLGVISAGRGVVDALSAFTAPAAELENVATSLGVVMGNAEAAERLTGSLERLATNGVVGFDELHRSARALTNVFQDDAVISHYVSRLADIAAGADIPASRLAELVARMEDMGKAELTELANKGVPIFDALAEVMGKSTAEVIKLSGEGKIGCSDLLAAFEKLTDAGGRYYQLNSELSNTTKGSWDTLKASITECMAVLGEPINDSLRPVLQDLAVWLQENKAMISAVGKGIVGVCTNVHTLTIGLGILAATMRGSMMVGMMRMAAGFKPIMAGLRRFRAEAAVTGSNWRATMVRMVAATRSAALAMKGALASTGVGLLVWGLGEAVAWCSAKFSDAEDAAQDMGAAAEEAGAATKEALEASRREIEQREEANRQEAERTRHLEEQARLAEQAAAAEQERLKAVREQVRAREDAEFEREMDVRRELPVGVGGGTAGVIRARLRAVGAPSEEALYAERARLEGAGHMSEEMKARYDAVAAAIGKIEEEHRKAEEAVREHAQRVRELRDNYYDRKSRAKQSEEDEVYEGLSISAQAAELRRRARGAGYWGVMDPAAIREYADELNRRDAEGNVRSIAQLERVMELYAELQKRKQEYQQLRTADMAELRIQALELQGRQRQADALREELALQERITELRERGATPRQARRQAEMEAKVRQAAEQRARIQAARVEFIQGHQASVGGGGVSFRLGSTQLQESRKHSRLLKEIRDYLRGQRNATSGVAVLA